ncbi:hypothetical protein [Acidihalobacter ferrooxydans]|uniref:Uncharacterized protein n=1 Tax=Acidihalobacter ferrooxydans TaxID=1765967 RepID=A0A1P8UEF5_9GAMM|nr:hypothetical protein [Acidihalobacter ferrooxydans]APZ42211.1 hypothetical protein BW247_03140 [Acidihalobacter ferrooxydans]
MEFYHKTPRATLDIDRLQQTLELTNLPELCSLIDSIEVDNAREGSLYCLWGAFDVDRMDVRCGTRFSLLNCPHAATWTVTYDAQKQELIVHFTIDKSELEPDFAESIQAFVDDWAEGLERALQ